MRGITPTSPPVSGVPPVDAAKPIHYQDDEEAEAPQPPTYEEDDRTGIEETYAQITPVSKEKEEGQVRYEEVIYKDEYGNIIPEDQLSSLLEEQGDNIEFRTVYETQTKILGPGMEPPRGAKRVPFQRDAAGVPEYPEVQNPETLEDEEKKAYRTA